MSSNPNQDVLNLASHFQQACGIFCMVADTLSRSLLSRAPFCEGCEAARCDYAEAHIALSSDTTQKGGAYLCPIRLSFLAAPLQSGERRLTLIAGPFISKESSASEFEHLNARLQKRIERLPRLTPKRARAICEILAFSAAGLNLVHPAVREPAKTGRVDIVDKIKEFILLNYQHKFTLDDVARHVFLSRSYISGIFRAETGKTLSSYINEVRIEKSKALLRETPLSLLDIALLCGFEDQSYFSKVFKASEGIAPKDYRALSLRLGWPES